MDYRIEKQEAFKVIAKRARYEGEGDFPAKYPCYMGKLPERRNHREVMQYVNTESIFGNSIVGICFDNPNEGDFDYAIGTAYQVEPWKKG